MSDITIVVRPLKDQHDRPVSIRLRQALKYLLRVCGLRCVSARQGDQDIGPDGERATTGRVEAQGPIVD